MSVSDRSRIRDAIASVRTEPDGGTIGAPRDDSEPISLGYRITWAGRPWYRSARDADAAAEVGRAEVLAPAGARERHTDVAGADGGVGGGRDARLDLRIADDEEAVQREALTEHAHAGVGQEVRALDRERHGRAAGDRRRRDLVDLRDDGGAGEHVVDVVV